MAPQASIPLAATILGLIGTVLWCVQLIPQIWKSHRTKSTEGLPSIMLLLWAWTSLPFGIYAISQNFNVPLQVQPQCFSLFCTISWGQCMVYGRGWTHVKAGIVCTIMLVCLGGIEALFILVLRGPYADGKSWAEALVMFFGILACIMLVSGFIPVPPELIKRRGRLYGFSLLFLAVDWSGAFFSLMSLVAQNTFDPEFGTLYALCALIELLMFISHGVWRYRTRHLHKAAKEAGVSYDDYPPAIEWQSKAWDVGFDKLQFGKRIKKVYKREKEVVAEDTTNQPEVATV